MKIIFGIIIVILAIPMFIIQIIWHFGILLPWVTADSLIEILIIKLDKTFNPKNHEGKTPEEDKSKSKFQQRLDEAIKVVRR